MEEKQHKWSRENQFALRPFSVGGREIAARPSEEADHGFCERLTHEAMGEYVRRTWPDDAAAYQEYVHRNRLKTDTTQIIQCDGVDIGRLAVSISDKAIKLDNMQLLPEYQKQGIGTKILCQLIDFSRTRKQPLHLLVLENNPARGLYEKAGFVCRGRVIDHRQAMERPCEEQQRLR